MKSTESAARVSREHNTLSLMKRFPMEDKENNYPQEVFQSLLLGITK